MIVICALNLAQQSLSLLEHNFKSHKIYWDFDPIDFVCIGDLLISKVGQYTWRMEQFPSCLLDI